MKRQNEKICENCREYHGYKEKDCPYHMRSDASFSVKGWYKSGKCKRFPLEVNVYYDSFCREFNRIKS